MILHVHSDASYLTEPEARSRAGGHFFLSNDPQSEPILNAPILSLVKVIRAVMSSAAEAELGATFYNCKEAVPLRTALIELGHQQPATPVQVDNATAVGIANRTVKQIRSRAMDMRFYWLQDRIDQNQFHIFWAPGGLNLADFYTKHHPIHHHKTMRPIITNNPPSALPSQYLRGCIDPGSPVPYPGIARQTARQPAATHKYATRPANCRYQPRDSNAKRIAIAAE
jgi:hypothetical protein